MQVTAYLADRGKIAVADMDDASVLEMREAIEDGDEWLQWEIDGDTVLLNARQIVRIDIATGGR